MPQVSTKEFKRLQLRVHTFLAGVPLHDVWSVDLPRWRAGVTLDEFLRTTNHYKVDTCGCSKSSSLFTPSPLVRMLLDIRFFVGRFFGWDREPAATASKTFATRLTGCSAEHPGRDTDCLLVLFRDLRPQGKPLHAVLHGIDRSFSENDRLSVPTA